MTSGGVPGPVAGRDCTPSGTCVAIAPSIFAQTAGSWRVYAELMPSNCSRQNTPDGLYVPRHTVAPYFTDLNAACLNGSCRSGRRPPGRLPATWARGRFPRSRWSCPTPRTTPMAAACRAPTRGSPAGSRASSPRRPTRTGRPRSSSRTTPTKERKNHIATTVIAPSVKPGTVAAAAYCHYSMLRTIEDMLGLTTTWAAPQPRRACGPRSTSRGRARHSARLRCGASRPASSCQIVPLDVRAYRPLRRAPAGRRRSCRRRPCWAAGPRTASLRRRTDRRYGRSCPR